MSEDVTLTPRKNVRKEIVIRRTPNAYSRTKLPDCTREDIQKDTQQHIQDVQAAMNYLGTKVAQAGFHHDKTKIIYNDEYIDLVDNDICDDEFLESDWWIKHITEERHHLNSNCPLDVNLIDVLEMISDYVMQGKGRNGYINSNDLKILDPTLLERAYWNTVKLLDDLVVVH